MDHMGFGYEAEGAQVPQADPCQYYVAQLPTGGLHHRGVPEPGAQMVRSEHMSNYCTVRLSPDDSRQVRDSFYLMKTAVTKNVAIWPRQAKTTAAMGSGSPHRRYSTGIKSQPGDVKEAFLVNHLSELWAGPSPWIIHPSAVT